jgi:hypothetical protein
MTASPAHIEALQSLGYAPQEARFLYVVATHSGYFIARQFLRFTDGRSERATRFCAKLRTSKHARTECFPKRAVVYHLFADKIYRYLGREPARNSHEHELEHVERRLAILDFVLSHPDLEYLETEPEKCAYFEQTIGIASHHLPCKTYRRGKESQPTLRYFVDRFPMYVDRASSAPVVTLSYIQPAAANLTGFARHLEAYLPLFQGLSQFHFLYLARSDSHFDRAREIFDSLVTIPLDSNPADELLRYFAIRKDWDNRQYGSLTEADLIFRNKAKQRFSAPRFEQLYCGWKTGRISQTQVRQEFQTNGTQHAVRFEPQLLKGVGLACRETEEQP